MWKFLAGVVLGVAAATVYAWLEAAPESAPAYTEPPTRAPTASPCEAVTTRGRPANTVARAAAPGAPATPQTTSSPGAPPVTGAPSTKTDRAAPGPLDIPGGKLGAQSPGDTNPLDGLLDAFRAYCEFGPGAGGNWPRGKLFPHAATWNGGPVNFDLVDLVAGKARMKNDSGLTYTPDGELDVKVIANDAGLHFTVIKPNGELMITTIYAALDAERRYRAAVSLHGSGLDHETAQFYGYCTL